MTVDYCGGPFRASHAPLALSPDGKLVALTVQSKRLSPKVSIRRPYGSPSEFLCSRLLILDLENGQLTNAFPDESSCWGAVWSPDGTKLATIVHRGDNLKIGIWGRNCNSKVLEEPVFSPTDRLNLPQWMADGEHMAAELATRDEINDYSLPGVRVLSYSQDAALPSQESIPASRSRSSLVTVNTRTGVITPVLCDRIVRHWLVSPTSAQIVVISSPSTSSSSMKIELLDVLREETGITELDPGDSAVSDLCWSPNGDSIGVLQSTGPQGSATLRVIGWKTTRGISTLIIQISEPGLTSLCWDEAGEAIVVFNGKSWRFYSVIDGTLRRAVDLKLRPGWTLIDGLQPALTSTLAPWNTNELLSAWVNDDTRNLQIVSTRIDDSETSIIGEYEMKLTNNSPNSSVAVSMKGDTLYLLLESINHPLVLSTLQSVDPHPTEYYIPGIQSDHLCSCSHIIDWLGPNGSRIRGTLALPPHWKQGSTPLPMIVDVYGGRLCQDLVHTFGGSEDLVNCHILTQNGYAVFYPDMPISRRDPVRQIANIVLSGVNHAIELGIADPDRLGIMGHSYGGYCAMGLLIQTKRVKAAVAASTAVNLTSIYGALSDTGDSIWMGWAEVGQGNLGGSLWDKRDDYIENSPLFYFDRVSTPLMVVAGTEWPGELQQAYEAFSGLRRLKKTAELRIYEESHWPEYWCAKHFCDLAKSVLRWFSRYM